MGDNREDRETAALVFPSLAIMLWALGLDKMSLSELKRPLSASSHEKSLWHRWEMSDQAAKQIQRGCRVQLLSHWGVKIGTVGLR